MIIARKLIDKYSYMESFKYFSAKGVIPLILAIVFMLFCCSSEEGDEKSMVPTAKQQEAFIQLIDAYVEARSARDTALLKDLLTSDIDQLTSSGNWRRGVEASIQGMQRSSSNKPGKRTIDIESVRLVNKGSAIVDTRYVIENAEGSVRRMWSTFVVKFDGEKWKITAIRNMLPANNN